jgi:hypothetical protein
MISKKHIAVSALAACALALTALASVKPPVTRPFEITAQMTWTLDWSTGNWEASDCGEATHVGRYTNHGSGRDYTLKGAHFTLTAANGDQILAVLLNEEGTSVGFSDGSGRFLGCSGGFDTTSSTLVSDTRDGHVEHVTYAYTGKGTIAY